MKSQQLYDTNYLNQEQGSLVAQILETQRNLTNSINLDITSRVIKKENTEIMQKEYSILISQNLNLKKCFNIENKQHMTSITKTA
ncbi:PREDICTED: uncharacterized protein LOC105365812 isoform X2 [Ceratosolen solmsi marchali]|uniref:Uncharacterized protein LOC105365812 isoform X2 n=1 Tax=Ceratosolen solmsi marchali TaxID=326594 RepID=A0AAJ6YQF0_9HYME|nr:PREDICTED: uncharacterized protein LOC105365812 isoform X2 [Ceratosolen solmsi marchali]